jgi:hypothetical protein
MVEVYYIHVENKTMKPSEIILSRGCMKEKEGRVNLIKIYCKHLSKCHKYPLYNNNMLKIIKVQKVYEQVYADE